MKYIQHYIALSLITLAILLTAHKSLRSIIAVGQLILDPNYEFLLNSYSSEKNLKRKLQHFFLQHDVYIPLEDFVVLTGDESDLDSRKIIEQACGNGNLHIWLPLPLRIPILGERVIEWCLTKK